MTEQKHGLEKADKRLTLSLRDRATITNRLATHFRISPKSDLKESTEMDQDVLYYPLLDEKGFYRLIYAGHIEKKLMFDQLFYGKKFLKSWLYSAIQEAKEHVPVKRTDDIVVSFKFGEWLWVAYESENYYEGKGGILIQTDEGPFTAEPLDNFLQHNYPPPESE